MAPDGLLPGRSSLPPIASTHPRSVARLELNGVGVSTSLVHTEPPPLLLVDTTLKRSSAEQENIVVWSER